MYHILHRSKEWNIKRRTKLKERLIKWMYSKRLSHKQVAVLLRVSETTIDQWVDVINLPHPKYTNRIKKLIRRK